ncbi:hypothetical protein E2C01_060555 [Portunus trituberculatus]|uniref:Uncharacterized protein n=1 Tax=Portunus trituberculatus TaxID=210409 RepID=A0A5B7HBR6_PORTR|nr:hypothetical protein [Portunus trituberculatus]
MENEQNELVFCGKEKGKDEKYNDRKEEIEKWSDGKGVDEARTVKEGIEGMRRKTDEEQGYTGLRRPTNGTSSLIVYVDCSVEWRT